MTSKIDLNILHHLAQSIKMIHSLNIVETDAPSKPWYHKGLHFKCTGCGQCCTGAPGYTWVNTMEIEAIAAYLKISVDDFAQRYLIRVGERLSLLENPKNYDCVFLKNKQCSIYPVRPKQCRSFPWWPQNVTSEAQWINAAKDCEGIHDEAPLISWEEIEAKLEAP